MHTGKRSNEYYVRVVDIYNKHIILLYHIEGEIMFVCVLTHDSTALSRHVLYKQSAISEGKLDSNQNPGSSIKSYNHNLYIKRNFEMSIF